MAKGVTVELTEILKKYTGDVTEVVEQSAKEAAEVATRQLKNTSPKRAKGGRHYANGWAVKETSEGMTATFTVYNRTKPQLTHLLENGHIVRNKKGTYGRAPAIKHIAPAEETAAMKFEYRVKARLRRLG